MLVARGFLNVTILFSKVETKLYFTRTETLMQIYFNFKIG